MTEDNMSKRYKYDFSTFLHQKHIDHIHFFAALCFYIFGVIYFFLLKSEYLLISNTLFGTLCIINMFSLKKWQKTHRSIHIFLLIVYFGLANVVIHIGNQTTPMLFWGLTVPLAAAFMCAKKKLFLWSIAGFLFAPLCIGFKLYIVPERVIELNELQYQVLTYSSYVGILLFVAYTFYIFQTMLEKSIFQIKQNEAELENLVKVICHDITGPLSALKIRFERALKLIASQEANPTNAIENIKNSIGITDRIFVLINQVKAYSQAHFSNLNCCNEQTNVLHAIEESLSYLQERLAQKKISVEFVNLPTHPIYTRFNAENLIFQVFTNILSNAIKFSSEGEKIHISIKEENDFVSVDIEDHGIGIPPPIINQLGKLNSAALRVGTSGERGNGYGLSIAHAFLEKNSGTISFSSVEKSEDSQTHGTIVHLRFRKAINPCLSNHSTAALNQLT